jgi:hypothetical protein
MLSCKKGKFNIKNWLDIWPKISVSSGEEISVSVRLHVHTDINYSAEPNKEFQFRVNFTNVSDVNWIKLYLDIIHRLVNIEIELIPISGVGPTV